MQAIPGKGWAWAGHDFAVVHFACDTAYHARTVVSFPRCRVPSCSLCRAAGSLVPLHLLAACLRLQIAIPFPRADPDRRPILPAFKPFDPPLDICSSAVTDSRDRQIIQTEGGQTEKQTRQAGRPADGSVMFAATRRWFRRNRTPIAIGVGVVGAGYVATQYVLNKLNDARERMSGDRIAKEKCVLSLLHPPFPNVSSSSC